MDCDVSYLFGECIISLLIPEIEKKNNKIFNFVKLVEQCKDISKPVVKLIVELFYESKIVVPNNLVNEFIRCCQLMKLLVKEVHPTANGPTAMPIAYAIFGKSIEYLHFHSIC